MPLKALLNTQMVFARDVAGTGAFICAECADPMHYVALFKRKDGVRVQSHFAHNPSPAGTPRTCSSIGQSEEHMNAKECIRLSAPECFWWLSGIVGDVEVKLDQRRADVLFMRPDGRRIVFEPQFTKIPRAQIAERTKDYHAMGCDVVWCFPEKRSDLFTWAKRHFYCVGQLSDDGNDVTFWGDLNPDKHAPGLRAPFDAECLPVVELHHDPKADAVMTFVEGDWTYTKDGYGDWRATNGNRRTRLKGSLDWAKHDVRIGRLQTCNPQGTWIDHLH